MITASDKDELKKIMREKLLKENSGLKDEAEIEKQLN